MVFELVSCKQQLTAISADKHISTPCPLQFADENDVELQVLAAWVTRFNERGNCRVWCFYTSVTIERLSRVFKRAHQKILRAPQQFACLKMTSIAVGDGSSMYFNVLQDTPSLTTYHQGIAAPCYVAALHCKKQGCYIARCCTVLMISCCINA